MERISRIWFASIGAILMLVATCLAIYGIYDAVGALLEEAQTAGDRMLTSVGYLVIATAIFEVAKYIVEEEVIRERELRNVSEVRRSLTRFTSTIVIVVLLEGIVGVFKVANKDVTLMLYPTALLLTGIIMLVGLGTFQRLASQVEKDVGRNDVIAEKTDSMTKSNREKAQAHAAEKAKLEHASG